MVRLKRILLTVFVCQVLLVIIMVRNQILQTSENNRKASLFHQYVARDKILTTPDKSNRFITTVGEILDGSKTLLEKNTMKSQHENKQIPRKSSTNVEKNGQKLPVLHTGVKIAEIKQDSSNSHDKSNQILIQNSTISNHEIPVLQLEELKGAGRTRNGFGSIVNKSNEKRENGSKNKIYILVQREQQRVTSNTRRVARRKAFERPSHIENMEPVVSRKPAPLRNTEPWSPTTSNSTSSTEEKSEHAALKLLTSRPSVAQGEEHKTANNLNDVTRNVQQSRPNKKVTGIGNIAQNDMKEPSVVVNGKMLKERNSYSQHRKREENIGDKKLRKPSNSGNVEQKELGNVEQKDFGNVEQKDLVKVEQKELGKVEQKDLGNVEQKDLGNVEQKELGNVEQKDFGNVEQKDLVKVEQKELGKVEQKDLGNVEQKVLRNVEQKQFGNVDQKDFGNVAENEKRPTTMKVVTDNLNSPDNKEEKESVISHTKKMTYISEEENKQAVFTKNWCRVQEARTDWKSILKPCKKSTVWGENTMKLHRPTSALSSFISNWDINPVGSYSRFVVQSISENNETKSIGGDSWRVHLRGPSTIAPTVFDHNDGSYEVLFLVMEPGRYILDMWLDYTLCNGFKDPPPFWFRAGNPQGKNQPDGILQGDKPFLIKKFRLHEPQVTFDVVEDPSGFKPTPKRGSCSCPSLHWDGLGRWVGDAWQPYIKEKVPDRNHSNRQGSLIIFGDSLANHFHESLVAGPYKEICSAIFTSCRKVYNWVYNMRGYWGDGVTSPREPKADGKDYDHNRVLHDVREVLYEPTMDKNSVLFLNWGIHFAAVVSFDQYRKLIQEFAKIIQHGETDPETGELRKFKGQFFWKTTTAINRQRWPNPHKDVRRFLTFPRILLFNALATSIMCQAGIDVIDVYPISDAYPRGTVSNQDPVHYSQHVFRDVERLLYETFANE